MIVAALGSGSIGRILVGRIDIELGPTGPAVGRLVGETEVGHDDVARIVGQAMARSGFAARTLQNLPGLANSFGKAGGAFQLVGLREGPAIQKYDSRWIFAK